MSETFLNGRVVLRCGDSRDVLKTIPDCSIDSIVTDPPYALVSIVKRFGNTKESDNTKTSERVRGRVDGYARLAAGGFMGKQWDTGETVESADFWAECMRVLKPGAHLVAFSGTRTQHRQTCAIEDAGFEVRDTISWNFGSGFPKSHSVSKGIDKARNSGLTDIVRVCQWIADQCDARCVSRGDLDAAAGTSDMGGWWASRLAHRCNIPTLEQWRKIEPIVGTAPDWMVPLLLPSRQPGEAWDQREVTGRALDGSGNGCVVGLGTTGNLQKEYDITAPATPAAQQWEGWGTALKPAMELICLARKPLSEKTVAANVLKWGTGAINIDGCRVEGEIPTTTRGGHFEQHRVNDSNPNAKNLGRLKPQGVVEGNPLGRWPANVIHDSSAEVIAAFPSTTSGSSAAHHQRHTAGGNGLTHGKMQGVTGPLRDGDSGSAARFFYSAKADQDDRLGSRHPTIKPVDLMQYLCRLVTPPGGTILDCFAGTGTTGEAAFREGFNAVLIEREPEYISDIRRRMALCMSGPDERARESIKAKNYPIDHGPLFAEIAE